MLKYNKLRKFHIHFNKQLFSSHIYNSYQILSSKYNSSKKEKYFQKLKNNKIFHDFFRPHTHQSKNSDDHIYIHIAHIYCSGGFGRVRFFYKFDKKIYQRCPNRFFIYYLFKYCIYRCFRYK